MSGFDPQQRIIDAAERAQDRFRRVLNTDDLEPAVLGEEQGFMLFQGMDVDAAALYRLAIAQSVRLVGTIVAANRAQGGVFPAVLEAAALGIMVEGILLGFELGVTL